MPALAQSGIIKELAGYGDFLADIKERIQAAQLKAALSVSREMVWLYWQIGHEILERQGQLGWGAKVVDRLAADLKAAYPGVTRFSRTNLLYMRSFAEAYPDRIIVQQMLDNSPLPWGHHIRLLEQVKDAGQRLPSDLWDKLPTVQQLEAEFALPPEDAGREVEATGKVDAD